MSAIQGEGAYRYEISNDWAKVPPGMEWREVGSGAGDHPGNVYLLKRGPPPKMVLDGDGKVLGEWGGGRFARPEGAPMAPGGAR
jgi:hypothetical protein